MATVQALGDFKGRSSLTPSVEGGETLNEKPEN
jgi:hypothetical protein